MSRPGFAISSGGPWRYMKCRICGYEMVWDTCGCILPLCREPSQNHEWEMLAESHDRNIAADWKFSK